MERGLGWQEISHRNLDLSQRISVDEVQAASSIHEHLFGGETSNLRFEDQSVMAWSWDLWWVI
jgi:hypothetical protein